MNTKTKPAKADDPADTLQAARTALHLALLSGKGDTAALRARVRELESDAQRAADAQSAQEAAERQAAQSASAEREASIRAASITLQEARNARLNVVRAHLSVRTVPDTRSSFN
jgi:hypothetical protein